MPAAAAAAVARRHPAPASGCHSPCPPLACRVVPSLCRVQALVLSPTRELATQTEKLVLAIGDFMNIQAHACIGGHSVGECVWQGGSGGAGGVSRRVGRKQSAACFCV